MQRNQDRRIQLLNLTTLRFLAAFSVFLHHLDVIGLHPSRSLGGMNLSWTVSFFFVLSGFVLAYSYSDRLNDRRAVTLYLLHRAARLWPVHIVCLLLLAALIDIGGVTPLQLYLFLTLQNAWLPAYGSGFALNSVSWSISVEIFFYALFPLVIRLPNRPLLVLFVANAALIACIVMFFSITGMAARPDQASDPLWYASMIPTGNSILLFFPPVRLIEFLAGILTYRVFVRVRLPVGLVGGVQLASIAMLLGYMTQHASLVKFVDAHVSGAAAQAYRQFGAFPLFALTVFVFSHQSGPVSRVLSVRPLVYLGEISFAFYMVHQVVLRGIAAHWTPVVFQDRIAAALLALFMSLVLASLLSLLVEKPFLAWAKTFGREKSRGPRGGEVRPAQVLS